MSGQSGAAPGGRTPGCPSQCHSVSLAVNSLNKQWVLLCGGSAGLFVSKYNFYGDILLNFLDGDTNNMYSSTKNVVSYFMLLPF